MANGIRGLLIALERTECWLFKKCSAALPESGKTLEPVGFRASEGFGLLSQNGSTPTAFPFVDHGGEPDNRPDVGSTLVARLANELRLYIGKPDIIRPRVGADRGRMAALVVGAIDQQTANA